MSETYVAGFDGSAESRSAVELAIRLAQADDQTQEDYREEAEALLAQLEIDGIEKRAVKADSPARGLHDLAEELDAELIAVGTTVRREHRQQFETMLARAAHAADADYRMVIGDAGRSIAEASADFDLLGGLER